jgi:hypothetical protein
MLDSAYHLKVFTAEVVVEPQVNSLMFITPPAIQINRRVTSVGKGCIPTVQLKPLSLVSFLIEVSSN